MKVDHRLINSIKPLQITIAICLLCIVLIASCSTEPDLPQDIQAAMTNVPEKLDYNLHVKPILSDRCFACHGPDKAKQKGGLRLDLAVAYDKETESGRKAIVPGNLNKSDMFHRIISNDPEVMMPTPASHLTLTADEKAVLIKWIKEGAEYKPHWSLVPPEKSELPEVKNEKWVKNPIDNFVLAKLEAKGLGPNKEASKETLIRRLSFDLTGLPPTIEEVDAFLADKSPEAYERVVNRLLMSPHFGERMAVDWLDAARYADTHGYQDDGMRNVYPWREWVISSFNRNLSYDRFVTWQLAGDLLPKPSKEQILATCFLRNHPQSQEGGIIDEEYRTEYVADRVNTFGKAFLALSTECARCHDHKYDPITQKNYYQLFAFFNNNNEAGEIPYQGEASPTLIMTKPETEKILNYINKFEIPPLEKQLADKAKYRKDFEVWLGNARKQPNSYSPISQGLVGHFTFDQKVIKNLVSDSLAVVPPYDKDKVPQMVKGRFQKGLKVTGDMAIEFNKHLNFERNEPFSISFWVNVDKPGEEGPLFSRTNGWGSGWRGYLGDLNKDGTMTIGFNHVTPDNCITLKTIEKLPYKKWNNLILTYDGSSEATGIKFFINGRETHVTIVNDNLKQSMITSLDHPSWLAHSNFKLGQASSKSVSNVTYDEFKAYKRNLSVLEVRQLAGYYNIIPRLLKVSPSKLKPVHKEQLFEYYLTAFNKPYDSLQLKLSLARGKENNILTQTEEVMVYKELKTQRPTFILDRGAYDAPTTEVEPGVIESVLPFDEGLPKNRLGLAKWLTSDKQPLFSRVAVNRFWQQCFGQGIVKTSDDFGNQGELPTHMELLDWLAYNFRTEGWNVKGLIKQMVMSATYRQSSIPSREILNADPDNKLFSRAPSYRMSSEMIRDNALAASGLLVKKVGGKSVYPYQPAGLWEALATRNVTSYPQGHGEQLYRRSIYTVWKRSSPHPAMLTFDVPDRYACAVRRQKTSTPLQSLVLLNDVQFVEASRVLADKMIKKGGTSPVSRVVYAFRSLTSRYPRKEELNILMDLYKEELADFSKNPSQAKELLTEGEFLNDKNLNPNELATCMVVANTLMNFDEFVIKR
jgi:hypothetical protein